MDEALQTLAAALLQLVLSQPTFAASPGLAQITPPAVQQVPQQQIAAAVCSRPCSVRAYYDPGKGILLDEQLHPNDDIVARSILYHEIVHHVQHYLNSYAELPDCERYRRREREAYRLQNDYLLSNQEFVHMGKVRLDCPAA